MIEQLSWKVGGQQGEGIESTGEIFSTSLNRMGYFLYSFRHFSSRIKGGHTNNKIRISVKPNYAVSDDLDILVAFDQETIDLNIAELKENGVVIADSSFNPFIPESHNKNVQLFSIGLSEIAKEIGTTLMKNMVAIGVSAKILNLPIERFYGLVEQMFSKKGENIVDMNKEALRKGYEQIDRSELINDYELKEATGEERLYMIGNEAIALGALAAGSKFMAAYPITPASEIMEYLIKKLPQFGGTVIQTEDEIAAVTMAIGANYAGARSFTASSGPGLSLMTEAIGLAGMTETPLVVVNTQRGGPSTGLPTKQEQSDVNAMLYGTHGEIPKIVLAPSTVEEAFYDTIDAFNLADKYQCPVILLTDLQLSLGKQSVKPFDYDKIEINRGKLLTTIEEQSETEYFQRYKFTEDGISPRPVVGTKNGIHHVTGVEHNEEGRPVETTSNRQKMMDKRLNKFKNFDFSKSVKVDSKHEVADVVLIGMSSTYGVLQEVKERLENENVKVNHVQVRLLNPFPVEIVLNEINKGKKIIVVENNATGQLKDLIKLKTETRKTIDSIVKYDGNPFLPKEVFEKVKELNANGNI